MLHSFTGGVDGADLMGLFRSPEGNLYGTTSYGALGFGAVFKLDSSGKETVLHTFTGGADGANPYAGVVADPEGDLYGTTPFGGAGFGVVFKLGLR